VEIDRASVMSSWKARAPGFAVLTCRARTDGNDAEAQEQVLHLPREAFARRGEAELRLTACEYRCAQPSVAKRRFRKQRELASGSA
jgi:hypothetical protein